MRLTVENEKVQKQSDRSQYSHEISRVNKKKTQQKQTLASQLGLLTSQLIGHNQVEHQHRQYTREPYRLPACLTSTYYWWLLRPTIPIRFHSKFQIIAPLLDSIRNEKNTIRTSLNFISAAVGTNFPAHNIAIGLRAFTAPGLVYPVVGFCDPQLW